MKGTAILLTGEQPDYIVEAAPLFFALGLVGLHAGVRERGGRPGLVGGALAWAGVGLALSSAVFHAATTDDEAFPLSATVPLTALSILASLVLLGVAVRRAHALRGRWRSLPLGIGAGVLPLLLVGGILETLDERLLEIPIVVLGLAWFALGYAIWINAPDIPAQSAHTPSRAKPVMTASRSAADSPSTYALPPLRNSAGGLPRGAVAAVDRRCAEVERTIAAGCLATR